MSDYKSYEVRVWADGSKYWYVNGKYHREDGPAIEYADGTKEWWINGKRHREDGPAIIWADGTKEWWIYNVCMTEKEFNSIKKATCKGKIIGDNMNKVASIISGVVAMCMTLFIAWCFGVDFGIEHRGIDMGFSCFISLVIGCGTAKIIYIYNKYNT